MSDMTDAAKDTFTLGLSGEALQRIRERAAKEKISIEEYIRRALRLHAFFQDKLGSQNDVDVLLRYNKEGTVRQVDLKL